MTPNQKIEASREIRLWITSIVTPIILGGGMVVSNDPELRAKVTKWMKDKYSAIKDKIKGVKGA
jgi:hypothetical protein